MFLFIRIHSIHATLRGVSQVKTEPYGVTPLVDGENFEIKRTFLFRYSTIRLLNKLKAEHEDVNAYLSSIIDEAIRFYYREHHKEG